MPTTNTARPARTRRAASTPKATLASLKADAEVASATEEVAEVAEVEAYVLNLDEHPDGPTKSFARFQPPKNSGCVGTFYAPLGTVSVRVRIEGPSPK